MDAPGRSRSRLFFAIYPDAQVAAGIARLALALRSEHALHAHPIRADRLHVTLHYIGDYAELPQDVVDAASRAAEQVAMPAFEVAFGSVSSFTGGRSRQYPFVLRGGGAELEQLMRLRRALSEGMQATGVMRKIDLAFAPHITLLYDQRIVPAQPVERIAWRVQEFVLVHSLLGKTVHRVLERWPLRADT